MSSEPKPGPRLVVIEGKEKGKIIALSEGVVVIGRSKGDVVIPDARISRSHVSLHFDASTGRLTFEDLKSLNGTQLNGETATSGQLKDGDRLQVGNTILDCQLGAETEVPVRKESKPAKRKKEEGVNSFADALRKEPKLTSEPSSDAELASDRDDVSDKVAQDEPKAKPWRLLAGLKKPNLSLRPPSKRARNLMAALGILGLVYVSISNKDKAPTVKATPVTVVQSEAPVDINAEIARLEEALKNTPTDADTLLELGRLYSKQGRYDEALVEYRKARAIANVSPLVHVRLINTFLRTNLTQEVEGELNALDLAIREGRHSKELFVEAASLYLEFREIKQPPEKTLILAKALQTEYAPGDPVGYKLEVQALLQQNRSAEALEAITKGLALAPNDEWFLENQAYIYLSQKEIGKAVASVDNWLTFFPQSSKPLLVMGYLKFNQKDYAGVIKYLQRIVERDKEGSIDPYLGESLSLMGQVYEAQGNAAQSASLFKASCDSGFEAACARVASSTTPNSEKDTATGAQSPSVPVAVSPTAAPSAAIGQPSPASLPQKNVGIESATKGTWPARKPNAVPSAKPK